MGGHEQVRPEHAAVQGGPGPESACDAGGPRQQGAAKLDQPRRGLQDATDEGRGNGREVMYLFERNNLLSMIKAVVIC